MNFQWVKISKNATRHCLLMVILVAAGLLTVSCEQIKAKQKPQTNTQPEIGHEPRRDDKAVLLLDDEPLLLLNDSTNAKESTGPMADNSRCFVCHVNYMQEALAASHARANIGCKDCHGESDAHIADESWASGGTGTPPNIMYPRAKINAACMTCHLKEKIETEQHQVFFASTTGTKVCTDCHGSHRLTHRKCNWR